MTNDSSWGRRVGIVFDTGPRDGTTDSVVWLPRTALERTLEQLLGSHTHVCIDGPTGTGKSSLAITALRRCRIPYTAVQLTQKMTWRAFCRRIVGCDGNAEKSLTAEVSGGFEKGLPHLGFKLSASVKGKPSDRIEYLKKLVDEWDENDVSQVLAENNMTLMVDDLERPDGSEIITRLADMAKLLTQTHVAPNARIIFIGTGDIYARLYAANSALDARIKEVSVGTLSERNESWAYIVKGLDRLGLDQPAKDTKISRLVLQQCIDSLYSAADGLLKSVSDIGHSISMRGIGRKRVTTADIHDVCDPIPMKNLTKYRKAFPIIIHLANTNAAVSQLLTQLYKRGVGRIHHWDDLLVESGDMPVDQLDNAVAELIGAQFLVRTGESGDVLFLQNPAFAHTLGVLLGDREKYPGARKVLGDTQQLCLPLLDRKGLATRSSGPRA